MVVAAVGPVVEVREAEREVVEEPAEGRVAVVAGEVEGRVEERAAAAVVRVEGLAAARAAGELEVVERAVGE